MNLKLLGFAPDADPTIAGVLTNCAATVPSLRGLKGAPSPAATALPALAATCTGTAVLAKLDNTNRFFAGTNTKLYEAASASWTDLSATAYGSSSLARWRFAQFGDVALATNANDTLQFSNGSGVFAAVTGAPKAAIVETVGQFVFVFNTNEVTFGTSPDRWWCSGIGNYTSWTPSIATQSATGRLTATPGPVTAAKRFGDGIAVYKNRSMYLGVYVGPPIIWAFQQVPGDLGALTNETVVNIGTPENPKHIFMGADNFYIFDGAKPVPIGTNRVKVQVYTALLQSRAYACAALHDRINSLVYFYYPVSDSALPDRCVVYNYRTDTWGQDDRQVEVPVEFVSPGITYDTLGNFYATYDVLPSTTYDQAFLSQALPVPAIFDTAHTPKTLTGASTSSSITTGDVGNDSQFSTLQRIRPRFMTAPTSASMVNFYRNNLGDSLSTDMTTALSSSGAFDVLRDARWHRVRLDFVGDWEMSVMDAIAEASGSE